MLSKLKRMRGAWSKPVPNTTRPIQVTCAELDALIAAVELAEAQQQIEALMPEIMSSMARNISDDEALELAANMNGASGAQKAALDAYRAAKGESDE